MAAQVIDVAKKVTNAEDVGQAAEALRSDALLMRDFQKEILHIEAEYERQLIQDRYHARERDMELVKVGKRNVRADVMVISAAIGLILCLYALSNHGGKLPGEAVGIISTIAGIFGACLKDAYAFEFGSSRGSRDKDSMLAQIKSRG